MLGLTLFHDDAFALFVSQALFILLEINTKDIPVKHSQINRSLKGQAKAFKDSPFNSSLQTGREPVDSRLQPRSLFGRATFHLQGEKTSLTCVVSSSMLLRRCTLENIQAKRKTPYVCNGPYHPEPLRHIGLKRIEMYRCKVRLTQNHVQKIMTAKLLYYV